MEDSAETVEDRRVAVTRQRVFGSALALIADAGVQACTFEAVSARSGVARSTLYQHWENKHELVMDALKSQVEHRVSPDTGNLRDDMLSAMLELGRLLEHSTWGVMVPQLMAAASLDLGMDAIQKKNSAFHIGFDVDVLNRAVARGDIAESIDVDHAALLFSAPIFYRRFYGRLDVSDKWITRHVDNTVELLRGRDSTQTTTTNRSAKRKTAT